MIFVFIYKWRFFLLFGCDKRDWLESWPHQKKIKGIELLPLGPGGMVLFFVCVFFDVSSTSKPSDLSGSNKTFTHRWNSLSKLSPLERVAVPKATPDADGWTKSLPKESWHPLKNGGFLMVKMRMEQSKQKLFKPPKIGGFDKMRMENVSCQKKTIPCL